ncbi:MAG: tryptophan synthase subunit alpha, partial [Candidatus Kaiserbacteria bacterium]|nr:tryptophan synthase subunit alpha [Candidatus Kaiserbacteria bacterium]
MKTIQEQLKKIKTEQRMGLMTHVVAGYPSLEATAHLIASMEEAGVDFIEIQIPFSDPAADGPVIMEANDVALRAGTTVDDCFQLMREVSKKTSIPLLFMSYYNILFRRGVDTFCREAQEAGVAGLIVPDMPVDEESHEHLIRATKKYNLSFIPVLSPTSTDDRLALHAQFTEWFVYCTARAGTTGVREHVELQLDQYLKKVRHYITTPLA